MCRDLTPVGDRRTWDGDDGSDTMKSDPKKFIKPRNKQEASITSF